MTASANGADHHAAPPLIADRDEISRFAEASFRNCRDEKGYIAIRGFSQATEKPVFNEWVSFAPGFLDSVETVATRLANRSAEDPAVFCPPVCLFRNGDNGNQKSTAGEADVSCGPVLTVDLDARPNESLDKLKAVFGEPTLIVASGGIWVSPEGAVEDKLHVHWRLKAPAISDEDRAELKRIRKKASRHVGADTSADPLCHPIRWPGSWHTKTETPRLCRIVGGDDKREIDLKEAAWLIDRAMPGDDEARPNGADTGKREGFKTKHAWPLGALMDAARIIPNEKDLSWREWNIMGMTLWDASHGGLDGLEAYHAWSDKHHKYKPDPTDARWENYAKSPPTDLSAGSLLFKIRKVEPGYRPSQADFGDWFEAVDNDKAADWPEGESEPSNWPEPFDIFGDENPAELATPPAGSLPPLIERWARSEARRKGVPVAFMAASAIATCAAAIGGSLTIRPRLHDDGWIEPAGLWVTLVVRPGNTKSAAINAALEPLKKLDAKWDRETKPLRDAWQRASKKRGEKAPDPGPEPRIRRCVVDNATMEQQLRIHADNPRGLMRATDELMGLLDMLGAYKNGAGGDRSQMLRLFDGDMITVDRVKSGATRAERALMSILASTQPGKIGKITSDLGSDGMLQRFLFIVDDGAERQGTDEAPDAPAMRDYARMVQELCETEHPLAKPIRLSRGAYDVLVETEAEIRKLKNILGASDAWQDHLSKWGKFLPRIMLVFHVISHWAFFGSVDTDLTINADTARMAALFARFLVRHSLRFYEEYYGASEQANEARWIAGYLLTRPDLLEVTRRDIYHARGTLKGDIKKLLAAMIELETYGWVEPMSRNSHDAKRWKVNPRAHERFANRGKWEKIERSRKREAIILAGEKRKKWLNMDSMSPESPQESVFD